MTELSIMDRAACLFSSTILSLLHPETLGITISHTHVLPKHAISSLTLKLWDIKAPITLCTQWFSELVCKNTL